jgi:hypothetical protein
MPPRLAVRAVSVQVVLTCGLAACGGAPTPATGAAGAEEALNARLVGSHDLQARSAYQPLPVVQGDRRILYVGHHAGEALNPLTGVPERNGTSILDVTDPANPVYLHHLPPTDAANGAQMAQVCPGRELPGAPDDRFFLLRPNGNQSHEIWDVTDPAAPAFVTTVARMGVTPDGETNTHKNWWECETGMAYVVGTKDGWRAPRIVQVFDLSDPAAPRHIRDFSLPGVEPGATGPVPGGSGVHEVTRLGNRLYVAYGTSNNGVIQIVDRDRLIHGNPAVGAGASDPFAPTLGNLTFPEVGRLDLPSFWGAHTALPLLDVDIADYARNSEQRIRDFVVVVSEAVANQCQEPRHAAWIVDITDEAHPFAVATFQVDEADGDFCQRGGRFGPHAPQWSMAPPLYPHLVAIAYFNAGARVVDLRNPFQPREAAWYIPAVTANTDRRCATIDGVESCKRAIQTNNVEVDDRGLIYLADRANTGVHIVELTGPAADIARP